jgi:hypothetical protein
MNWNEYSDDSWMDSDCSDEGKEKQLTTKESHEQPTHSDKNGKDESDTKSKDNKESVTKN